MPRYYPQLDVLRGVAALLVLWYHVIEVGRWTEFPSTGPALLLRIGWIGVDLFFVISGFVIGKTALEGQQRNPAGWRRNYISRRLRRIVPLYVATLFAYLLLVDPGLLQTGRGAIRHVAVHLLFVHNWWVATTGSINGPNWSVALEMQFYVLMLVATPWISRHKIWMLWLWVLLAMAWRFGATLVYPPGVSPYIYLQTAATQLPGALDAFAFGIMLARLAMAGQLRYSPLRLAAWAAAAFALLWLASTLFWPRAYYWHSWQMVTFWRTLLYAGFAALLAVFVLLPSSGGWLTWPLRYLGEISYGIYLWHLPVLLTLIEKTAWRGADLLAATVACTLVLASLSWHGFEKLWLRPRQGDKGPLPQAAARQSLPVGQVGSPAS